MKPCRVIELSKEGKKVLVTLWDENQISSCVQSVEAQSCESCQGDEGICNDYISFLKERGYEARDIPLAGVENDESLPKFLEKRQPLPVAPPTGEGSGEVHGQDSFHSAGQD